jgi:hypothetical protein
MQSQRHVKRPGVGRGGRIFAALCLGAVLLAGCGNIKTEGEYPDPDPKAGRRNPYAKPDSMFGAAGLTFGTGKPSRDSEEGGGGIGVNSFLWRASLDTVAFMPVSSADPFGGVIITDWYAMPEAPNERFKINVYILGRALRADGVKVAVFRQVQGGGGEWQDAAVPVQTATSIEDSILSRARQLRYDTMQQ